MNTSTQVSPAGLALPGAVSYEHGSYSILKDPAVWLLVAGALAFRMAYNLALHPGGHGYAQFVIDEREYFGAAHVLAEGRGFSFYDTAMWVRPPLYLLLLASLLTLFGNSSLAPMVVQSLISALTLLPLGWLALRLGGVRAARLCVGLGALYLPFALFSGLLLSETLFLALFSGALVPLVKCRDALTNRDSLLAFRWAALCGLLVGLAALTRGTALGFVPLAAFWLLLPGSARRSYSLRAAAALALTAFAALIPWTIRNYAAYGRFVVADTTSGYNLWLGSTGVRDEARLLADLRQIPNPVDKQTFAFERAWENIRNDPAGFVVKGIKESIDLWRPLFSAEERQTGGYTLGRVPTWHLLSLLVFDDLLYVLVLAAAAYGLIFLPANGLRSLTLLWVLLWVALSFIFFAVTRFRVPVVALLLPWAAVGLLSLRLPLRTGVRRQTAALGLTAVLALVVLPALPFGATALGVQRWQEQAPYRAGERALQGGSPEQALALYRQANTGLADTRYSMAAALIRLGQSEAALGLLRPDEPRDRFEPFILRGEVARQSGDARAARAFFNERVVKLAGDDALRWAWDHLDPPPAISISVGSGLDIGYIRGFYAPEQDEAGTALRWSGPEAEVRNIGGVGSGVFLKLSGWRPTAAPPARARLCAGEIARSERCQELESGSPEDKTFRTAYGNGFDNAGSRRYELFVEPFVPGGSDPRLLGIRISEIGATK